MEQKAQGKESGLIGEWNNKFEDDFPNGFLASREDDDDLVYQVMNAWTQSVDGTNPTVELILFTEPGGGKTLSYKILSYQEIQDSPRIVRVTTDRSPWRWSGDLSPELAKAMKSRRDNRPGDEPEEKDKPTIDRNDLSARQIIGKLLLGEQ